MKISVLARLMIVPGLIAGMAVLPLAGSAQDATPVGNEAGGMGPPMPPGAELVASGLDNPRGLAFGPDGALYVAEAGGKGDGPCIDGPEGAPECYGMTSAITVIRDGQASRLVEGIRSRAHEDGSNATGVHDIAFAPDGTMYAVVGLGNPPDNRTSVEKGGAAQLGRLFSVDPMTGEMTEVADIAGYEATTNPDAGAPDSNPYSIDVRPDGNIVVADAGGNFVGLVTPDGQVSTLATLASRPETGPDGSEIPMQPVPDSVAVSPDGTVMVGELTGFPFPAGAAQVWQIGADGKAALYGDGFTNIIDLDWTSDGTLGVLELFRGGMMSADPSNMASLEGRLVLIFPDGSRSDLASTGLMMPGGLAIGPDGYVYITVMSVAEDMGSVIRLPMSASDAAPMATPAE